MRPCFKKYAFLVLALMGIAQVTMAQDTLYLVNREQIQCRVKSVNRSDVDYVLWSSQSGPLYAVSKSLVHKIVYETGSSLVLNEMPEQVRVVKDTSSAQQPAGTMSAREAEQKGREDAENNYDFRKIRNNAILLGVGSTIFYLVPGLVATAVIAGRPPNDENLNLPDSELFYANAQYRESYRLTAKRIKSRKVWGGFLTGAGIVYGAAAVAILLL
jgi:hypothetical protein